MNDPQLIDRATKAKAVLESPAYEQSWADVRAAIIALIEKTPLGDTQTAEDLRRCLKLLRDVRANLEAAMNAGKLPEFRIVQEQKRRANPLAGFFK